MSFGITNTPSCRGNVHAWQPSGRSICNIGFQTFLGQPLSRRLGMDHSSRKRVRLTSDMTPLADRFARTAIMTMPMIPPSRSKRTPHRTAVRRTRAPVTVREMVLNGVVGGGRRGGQAASVASPGTALTGAGKGGIFSQPCSPGIWNGGRDSVMVKSRQWSPGESPAEKV